MKRLILAICILLLLLVTGCTQPVTPAPTPVPTFTPQIVTTPVLTPSVSTTPYKMQVNVTAWQKGSDVYVQYNGGADAAYLLALRIRIDNYSGQATERTINYPVIGNPYIFTYMGTPDADRVNVVGVFQGGTEQTVLLTTI
jgi:hypothetical protein